MHASQAQHAGELAGHLCTAVQLGCVFTKSAVILMYVLLLQRFVCHMHCYSANLDTDSTRPI